MMWLPVPSLKLFAAKTWHASVRRLLVNTLAQFSLQQLILTMPPKGKGRKAEGASHSASLTKRATKAARKKQVPVPTLQVLDQSQSKAIESGNQVSNLMG